MKKLSTAILNVDIIAILDAGPACGSMGNSWDALMPQEQALICEGCPALAECRAYAINAAPYGTWGGISRGERRVRKQQAKRSREATVAP